MCMGLVCMGASQRVKGQSQWAAEDTVCRQLKHKALRLIPGTHLKTCVQRLTLKPGLGKVVGAPALSCAFPNTMTEAT